MTAGSPRVAVVGAGPAGFYAAEALLRSGRVPSVDMYERLPVPFGLVRHGVAPDHPKLKQVTAVFERIAAMPGFRFIGGVEIGRDLDIAALRDAYHAVVLATGADEARPLGIPGETLPGSHRASDFVGWYNGHPDHRGHQFDFSSERAVILGHGNVALDVARLLVKTPDELRHTDIAAHALEALAESRIREVHVVGRRGPAEVRFSAKELQEFQSLAQCDASVDGGDFDSSADLDTMFVPPTGADPDRVMALALLAQFAGQTGGKPRRCLFRFHLEPISFVGQGGVRQTLFRRTNGMAEAVALNCGLVIASVGRRTPGLAGVPHDAVAGTFANRDGRIIAENDAIPGLYTCGWSRRGPSGTIGTNRACAVDMVDRLLADLDRGLKPPQASPDALIAAAGLRASGPFDFPDWRAIDAAEVERGRAVGKPREKFVTIADMATTALNGRMRQTG